MFLGLGQYETYDPTMWETWFPTPVTTPYSPGSSGGAQTSESILPILQSLITAAGQVGAKYMEVEAAKTQAQAQAEAISRLRAQQAALVPTVTPTTTTPTGGLAKIAGIEWPIWAILGVGAYLIVRGKKGRESEVRKRKRK